MTKRVSEQAVVLDNLGELGAGGIAVAEKNQCVPVLKSETSEGIGLRPWAERHGEGNQVRKGDDADRGNRGIGRGENRSGLLLKATGTRAFEHSIPPSSEEGRSMEEILNSEWLSAL